ncbi:unnamed protein product [Schistosoma margrebowiei]|uniref:Uncharacterized protein n=1 Tax=Schistosoma margrebowiei TaxID=48269 RepID=A0A183MWJ1_9TREM|nr:unnamed protein product [Schistosoma margrebowiei]
MKTSTSEGKHGIQWTARNQLDDLDFTDDLALLTRTHEQMQTKTASVAAVTASVNLNIHKNANPMSLILITERVNELHFYVLGVLVRINHTVLAGCQWFSVD